MCSEFGGQVAEVRVSGSGAASFGKKLADHCGVTELPGEQPLCSLSRCSATVLAAAFLRPSFTKAKRTGAAAVLVPEGGASLEAMAESVQLLVRRHRLRSGLAPQSVLTSPPVAVPPGRVHEKAFDHEVSLLTSSALRKLKLNLNNLNLNNLLNFNFLKLRSAPRQPALNAIRLPPPPPLPLASRTG